MTVKIPLFKAKTLGFERDMATLRVGSKNLTPIFVKAVIDTGCPYTILSENDLRNRRVKCSDTCKVVQMGPIPMQIKKIGLCELVFKDESNKPVSFEQEVYLGVPNVKGILAQGLPSFIGKDFLDNHSIGILNLSTGSFLLKD